MRRNRKQGWLLIAAACMMLWCFPARARAQCSMCQAVVANSKEGQRAASSINAGILLLLFPPVSMMCGIFVVAYRRRNSSPHEDSHSSYPRSRVRSSIFRFWNRATASGPLRAGMNVELDQSFSSTLRSSPDSRKHYPT